ncbi:hypothetical protein [Pelosinus baikalensis]|uniref:Uncharacterized protein n=1 Tax=Pelosinus baikalensis TaxID=2892015 RepID=A0ABS8HW25_9FIRM|nr:hypothetical protein [Pelosinus baikalensis]MCC5467361.1 hypothetical protein [Pelosinus baikalensis]
MKINNTSYVDTSTTYNTKNYQVLNSPKTQFNFTTTNNADNTDTYQKYDPQNCSYEEFCSTVRALAKEGKLTSHESLLLQRPLGPGGITDMGSNIKNWLTEFRTRASQDLSIGNMIGYARDVESVEAVNKMITLL